MTPKQAKRSKRLRKRQTAKLRAAGVRAERNARMRAEIDRMIRQLYGNEAFL